MSYQSSDESLKSRLFSAIAQDNDADTVTNLSRHMKDLILGIDNVTRSNCVEKLSELRRARTSRDKEAVITSISGNETGKHIKVTHALSVLNFLVDALLSENLPREDREFWAADMVTLAWIDANSKSVADELLNRLVSEYLTVFEAQDRQRRTEAGVLPSFKSVGITVEARAVRKQQYAWGTPLDGESAYVPIILGTAIIASVSMGLDIGNPKNVFFQIGEKDIDNLIASLMATKKEMDALRTYLRLKADGSIDPNA